MTDRPALVPKLSDRGSASGRGALPRADRRGIDTPRPA